METQVTTTQAPGALATKGATAAWGSEGLDTRDYVTPKLLAMQPMSKLVTDEKAKPGEIRNSLTGKLYGGKDKTLEVIVFSTFKNWIVFETKPGSKEEKYTAQIPFTQANCELAREEVLPNGVKVRRDLCFNALVVVPEEIATGNFYPYLLSFRRTSYKPGKILSTSLQQSVGMQKPVAEKVFTIGTVKTQNDKGTFYVFDVAEARATTEAELNAAFKWYSILRGTKVKVDDSDLERREAPEEHVQEPDGEAMAF